MRYVIYARVSSTKQEYDSQIAVLKQWLSANKHTLIEVLCEKVSGGGEHLDERTEYKRLYDYTKEQSDGILVWEFSRIGRDAIEAQRFCRTMTERGINVHIYDKNLDTINPDGSENTTSRLLLGLLAQLAEDERGRIKDRMERGKSYAIANGVSYCRYCYGYKLVEGHLVINKEEATNVRDMFEKYASGSFSLRQLGMLYGRSMCITGYMLRNRLYLGEMTYRGTTYYHPELKIIDEELFDAVNKTIKARRLGEKRPDSERTGLLKDKLYATDGTPFHICVRRDRKTYQNYAGNCPTQLRVEETDKIVGYTIKEHALGMFLEYRVAEKIEELRTQIIENDRLIAAYTDNAESKRKQITKLCGILVTLEGIALDNVSQQIKSLEREYNKIHRDVQKLQADNRRIEQQINKANAHTHVHIKDIDTQEMVDTVIDKVEVVYGSKLLAALRITWLYSDIKTLIVIYRHNGVFKFTTEDIVYDYSPDEYKARYTSDYPNWLDFENLK